MTLIYIIGLDVLEPYLGPSVVAHNLLRGLLKIEGELKKEGVEVRFISTVFKGPEGLVEVSDAVKVINTRRYRPITFTGELQAWLKSGGLERPDAVHSHNMYEIAPWAAKGVPTVFTLHGLFWREKTLSNEADKWAYYLLAERRLKVYCRKLARVVAISPYVMRELLARGIGAGRVELIENPVSEEFFNVKKKEEDLILYPAVLAPRKNQLTFLKAIALLKNELRDFRILFTGSGDLEYLKRLREYVQRKGLSNVEFRGKVPFNELLGLYSKAAIVSVVSLEETFMMALAEAMATGTPVVVSPVGIAPYAVESGKNGFIVSPDDPKEIAEALRVLAGDKKLRRKVGRNAKKLAAERWMDEVIARKHLEMYMRIVSGGM